MTKNHRHKRKARLFHRRNAPGTAPGVLTVDPEANKPLVRLMAYSAGEYIESELRTAADFAQLPQIVAAHNVTWINVEGLGDVEVVRRLGELFQLHPLALEDVLNNHQRSKVEQYGDNLFIVARMIEGGDRLDSDQLGMFLGSNYLITFQHIHGDCLDPLRERIRRGRGITRAAGPDYLAYAVLDGVVDSYFPILETFGEEIESLEDTIMSNADGDIISRVHDVKAKLLVLRRSIWPLRDALHVLVRDPNKLISDETRVYLRDCSDHTFQIMDLVETYRELAHDLLELYHSSLSNRMNEVMQVLTVIATIFIPLTFIVGVYGMNFDTEISPWNMPELKAYWGYPIVWAIMIVISVGMLIFFRRRGWLGGQRARHWAPRPPRD